MPIKKKGIEGLENPRALSSSSSKDTSKRIRELEKELKEKEMENEILKISGLSQKERISKKFEAITFLRKDYPVALLCRVINVSSSGYYAYLKRPKQQATEEDHHLWRRIKQVYALYKGTYGANASLRF